MDKCLDKHIDHRNRNGLDNRKKNLRGCTRSQNYANCPAPKTNKSGFKGVRWDKTRNKWKAEISLNDKNLHIGRFLNIEDAIRAYDRKAIELFGEFAYLNFPRQDYESNVTKINNSSEIK